MNIFSLSRTSRFVPAVVLAALLCLPTFAEAHRVMVVGWQEGDSVMVEGAFSNGDCARNSEIIVMDAKSGKELLRGATNEEGSYSFPVPAEAASGGLRIRINAGEGHVSECVLDAGEFAEAHVVSAATVKTEEKSASSAAVAGVSAEEIQKIVNAALDAKLGPIRRQLAAQALSGPTLRDVVGGIGWILGLVGIGSYFHSRKRK